MNLKLKHLTVTLALLIALTFCFERPAYAYVDPGSGLLAFQTFSAMITGGLFYFRRHLKSLLSRKAPKSKRTSVGSAAEPAR